jgi:hypothetical protein
MRVSDPVGRLAQCRERQCRAHFEAARRLVPPLAERRFGGRRIRRIAPAASRRGCDRPPPRTSATVRSLSDRAIRGREHRIDLRDFRSPRGQHRLEKAARIGQLADHGIARRPAYFLRRRETSGELTDHVPRLMTVDRRQ